MFAAFAHAARTLGGLRPPPSSPGLGQMPAEMIRQIALHLDVQDTANLAHAGSAMFLALPGATTAAALIRGAEQADSPGAVAAVLRKLEHRMDHAGPGGRLSLPQCIPTLRALLENPDIDEEGTQTVDLVLQSACRLIDGLDSRADRDAAELWSTVMIGIASRLEHVSHHLFEPLLAEFLRRPAHWHTSEVVTALSRCAEDGWHGCTRFPTVRARAHYHVLNRLLAGRGMPQADLPAWCQLVCQAWALGKFGVADGDFTEPEFLAIFDDLLSAAERFALPDRGWLLKAIADYLLQLLASSRLPAAVTRMRQASLGIEPVPGLKLGQSMLFSLIGHFLCDNPHDPQVRLACQTVLRGLHEDLPPRMRSAAAGIVLGLTPRPSSDHGSICLDACLVYLRMAVDFLENLPPLALSRRDLRVLCRWPAMPPDLQQRVAALAERYDEAAAAEPARPAVGGWCATH
ncbi:hypothetical protein GT347_09550 [Xylophilus rhododendri]|uniref:F-box domain-containing protein n=1 Tax=Xylophilus rhododendri TaxID=2697032 RepID=A0A857J2Q8_9BURK|nr:hypothetical protein [Xylophilus rhododendri]QHI98214.1 hypothetical protein GT347_09550 [Xylophilus rhododendri]